MTTIRVIYSEEPSFPATAQHPDAVRFQIGALWVDAIGGKPSQAEIDAVVNPPVIPVRDIAADLDALTAKVDILTAKAQP